MNGSSPALPLDQYAGNYEDAWYGDIDIAREGDGLVIDFTRYDTEAREPDDPAEPPLLGALCQA